VSVRPYENFRFLLFSVWYFLCVGRKFWRRVEKTSWGCSCTLVVQITYTMPDWKGPSSFDRFTALLDFQRNVDIDKPSHCASNSNANSSQREIIDPRKVSSSPQSHDHVRAGAGSQNTFTRLVRQQHHDIFSSSEAMEIDNDHKTGIFSSSFTQRLPQFSFSPRVFMFNALKRVLSRDDSSAAGILKRSKIMAPSSSANQMIY
jgi:hypothetical protein